MRTYIIRAIHAFDIDVTIHVDVLMLGTLVQICVSVDLFGEYLVCSNGFQALLTPVSSPRIRLSGGVLARLLGYSIQ